MKTIGYMALALVAGTVMTSTLCSCGVRVYSEKDKVEKNLTVNGDFNEIETLATTDIEYTQGPASFKLYAPESQIDKIEIYVQDGKLVVTDKTANKNFGGNTHSKLVVSYPSVSRFSTYGTGDITITESDVKDLVLITCGTGDIECGTAKCTTFNAISEGTGDIEVKKVNCTDAVVRTDGIGDIEVKDIMADHIDGSTNGTGDLYLAGRCKTSNLEKNGTGDITAKGLKKMQ